MAHPPPGSGPPPGATGPPGGSRPPGSPPPPGSGPPPGATPAGPAPAPPRSFRATLVRVMAVQVVTLLLLWVVQALYHVEPG